MKKLLRVCSVCLLSAGCMMFSGGAGAQAQAQPQPSSGGKDVLLLSVFTHIEPGQEYATQAGHAMASRCLKRVAEVFNAYGVKWTLMSALSFADGCYKYGNTLKDIEAMGHEVGTHAHTHDLPPGSTLEEHLALVKATKEAVDKLGVRNTTACAGWTLTNPFKDLADMGLKSANGYSEHGAGGRGIVSSRVAGHEIPLTPWRPKEDSGWTTDWMENDPNGRIVYVPFMGEAWGTEWPISPDYVRNVSLFEYSEDQYVSFWTGKIDAALGRLVPGKVNHRSLYILPHAEALHIHEAELDGALKKMAALFEKIDRDYVKTGRVQWATASDVVARYEANEKK